MDFYDATKSPKFNVKTKKRSPMRALGQIIIQSPVRFFAALALLLLLPYFGLFALLIRLTSPGPDFSTFSLSKCGGESIRVYCFRMTGGGSATFEALGRVLRRRSLDELPMLWNVLSGDVRLSQVFGHCRA